MAVVRENLVAQAVDELRVFVARNEGAHPRRGSRLARQLDVAQRVVAAFDRETSNHDPAGPTHRRIAA